MREVRALTAASVSTTAGRAAGALSASAIFGRTPWSPGGLRRIAAGAELSKTNRQNPSGRHPRTSSRSLFKERFAGSFRRNPRAWRPVRKTRSILSAAAGVPLTAGRARRSSSALRMASGLGCTIFLQKADP
jgi:hypothetical protein